MKTLRHILNFRAEDTFVLLRCMGPSLIRKVGKYDYRVY